jgi:hypothetical protein
MDKSGKTVSDPCLRKCGNSTESYFEFKPGVYTPIPIHVLFALFLLNELMLRLNNAPDDQIVLEKYKTQRASTIEQIKGMYVNVGSVENAPDNIEETIDKIIGKDQCDLIEMLKLPF